MSDTSQGPGWWQASDGKWYPPEQAPSGPTPGAGNYGMGTAGQFGPLATWGQRAVGYLIDVAFLIVLWIVAFIIVLVLSAISDVLGAILGILLYIVLSAFMLYYGFLVGSKGRSPGMALTGLRCVSEETGQVIGGGMGILRTICHFVDSIICYIGWLFPLWDEKRQTLADKIIKTVVVAEQPRENFGPELFKP